MATVAGGWLGEYHFDDPRQGLACGFEATFSPAGTDGLFHGTILDEGLLGEAVLHHARQIGEEVVFTKVYRKKQPGLVPVRYEGRFHNDGTRLSGTWAIFSHHRGVMKASFTGWWEARRTWELVEPS